jgi:hypothetical protein
MGPQSLKRESQPRKPSKPPSPRRAKPRAPEQPARDELLRSAGSDVQRRHGHTLIASLRRVFGADFAPDLPSYKFLGEVLQELDEASLRRLAGGAKAPAPTAPRTAGNPRHKLVG